ncbi:MAG: 2OG-Fe(II) oxygenase family protein [Acidimicrobiales bacterium]
MYADREVRTQCVSGQRKLHSTQQGVRYGHTETGSAEQKVYRPQWNMAKTPIIPVVDISNPDATSLEALDDACRDHGFFLLTGHGLDSVLTTTWSETAQFFDAPRSVRAAIMRDAQNPLGWYDRELTKRVRDHKEVFDFVDPSVGDVMNRWPDLPGFRDAMVQHFEAMSDLAERTLTLLHSILQLGDQSCEALNYSRFGSTVRLNLYTVGDPVPDDERDGLADLGEVALGHHTDPGTLTLLLQDDIGGLQALSNTAGWIDVPPQPGTIVVNLGDCTQAWTNDRYRAAVHRVIPMNEHRRYSIPYFANPLREAIVAPLSELAPDGPRYRPFAWRDFMAARAYDNFADAGAEDTQLTDYKM